MDASLEHLAKDSLGYPVMNPSSPKEEPELIVSKTR